MRSKQFNSSIEPLEARTMLSSYSITNLHALSVTGGSNDYEAFDNPDINAQGETLISISSASHFSPHATIFGPAATFPDGLVDRAPFDPNQINSGRDINNLDQIVGDYTDNADGSAHAFLSENAKHGRLGLTTLINLPGFDDSIAYSINNNGQVVGESDTSGPNTTAWIWQRGKKSRQVITALPALGTHPIEPGLHEQTIAADINDAGSIVGMSFDDNLHQRAVIWRPGKKGRYAPADLGSLPSLVPTSYAHAINAAGYVVGNSLGDDMHVHPVLFVPGKKGRYSLVELPTPTGMDGSEIDALNINNKNQIVGVAKLGENHAILWQPGRKGRYTAIDLSNQGGSQWQLGEATDINDSGVIVGAGIFQSGDSTWRLTPAPATTLPSAVEGTPFATTPVLKANKDLFA